MAVSVLCLLQYGVEKYFPKKRGPRVPDGEDGEDSGVEEVLESLPSLLQVY